MIRILHSVSNMDRAGIETMLMNYYRHINLLAFHACFLFLLCFFTFMPITRLKPEKVGKQQSIHGLLHSKYPLFLESYSCLFLSPQ